ncbi:MAG: hypothetical protein J1F11_01325 [Oscillospiraceae bacterium]|nr:hypothetical protein [Oscillospiraceae bacterium]
MKERSWFEAFKHMILGHSDMTANNRKRDFKKIKNQYKKRALQQALHKHSGVYVVIQGEKIPRNTHINILRYLDDEEGRSYCASTVLGNMLTITDNVDCE